MITYLSHTVIVVIALTLLTGCWSKNENSDVTHATSLKIEKSDDFQSNENYDVALASGRKKPNSGDLTLDFPNSQIAYGTVNSNKIYDSSVASSGSEKTDVKIIKNANIRIKVKESAKAIAEIERILQQNKAYISSQEQTKEDYTILNKATIRVNKNSFDTLVKEIESIAEQVDFKKVTMDDVTAEFVDVAARLKVKKETEAQYYTILKQSHSVQDILEVQEHLSEIREEIDASEGKLKYMNDQVAYSTINLDYYERLNQSSTQNENGFWLQIVNGSQIGWSSFLTFIVTIVSMWPLWIIVGFIYFVIKRFIKRKSRVKADTKA